MHRPSNLRGFRIALTGALAGALLGGCSTLGAPFARVSAGKAEPTLAQRQQQALAAAEAAVLDAPLDPALREHLGTSYLSAGRFQSSATALADAMALGDTTPATALRLALALTGSGRAEEAAALLFDRAEDLPSADLGLALALAGEVEPAIRILESAIRFGESNKALRQNLALAYALAGRWRWARLMAERDLPAGEIGGRMERWAAMAVAGAPQRLAMVLRAPAGVADAGMPVALAYAPAVPREAPRVALPRAPTLAAGPEAVVEASPAVMLAVAAEPAVAEPIRLFLPSPESEPVVAAPVADEQASLPAEAVAAVPPNALATTPSTMRPRTIAHRHRRWPGVRW